MTKSKDMVMVRLTIADKEIEMSVYECRQLRDKLNQLFGDPNTITSPWTVPAPNYPDIATPPYYGTHPSSGVLPRNAPEITTTLVNRTTRK